MKQIETDIHIQASPARVWEVLTDFEKQGDWNPLLKSISGKKEVGETLTVLIQIEEGSGMTVKPTLLTFDPQKEFRWRGKLWIDGIFTGEHYFKLIDKGNGETHFLHGENFSGFLVPLMTKMLEKTKKGFEQMNQALKAECEKE